MKRLFLTLLACNALVYGAHAYSVSFDLQADRLRSNATTDFPTTGLILLVASTSNATFGATITAGTSLTLGSFLDNGDDQILGRFDLATTSSQTAGVLIANPTVTTGGTFANLDGGDRLALYWFPSLTLNSTAVPAISTSYGTYQTGNTAPLNGSAAWTMPTASANNYRLYFFTTDPVFANPAGSHTPAEATASFLTIPAAGVPEPSSFALGVLGSVGLGWMVLRRRPCLG